MGGYTAKLARRITGKGQAELSPLITGRNMSPSAIRIGGGTVLHTMFAETHSVPLSLPGEYRAGGPR
ncbi:MAG: hypothetical protein ACLRZZ_28515 [Enterocloster sp.]